MIGRAHDPDCHGLRDFLSRNQVPFEWADPDEPWIAARTELSDAVAAAQTAPSCCCPTAASCNSPPQRSSPKASASRSSRSARRTTS